MDYMNISPLTLSFVGDGVYTLEVRKRLAKFNRPVGELHSACVSFVNATAQAKAFKVIEHLLTENETAVFKKGRNAHTNGSPQNSTVGEYHIATGVEALFGYLYLSGQSDRINELFKVIFDAQSEQK